MATRSPPAVLNFSKEGFASLIISALTVKFRFSPFANTTLYFGVTLNLFPYIIPFFTFTKGEKA